METSILSPEDLFAKDIRYTIPEFQRRYVWEQDEQWEPLWDDVRNTAESYLEELFKSDSDSIEARKHTPRHFLGAVVFQEIPATSRDIQRREVIDGQQRMTTLQLLLDAIQCVCDEFELVEEAELLSDLVTNRKRIVRTDRDKVFKLWPTNNDREAFRHAMDNGLATNDFEDSLIVQAHEFFQLQTRQWLNSDHDQTSVELRAEALEAAVTGMLQIVVIDLTSTDDPHVIFETLNARGTPLEESELIKNYTLSEASRSGLDQSGIWGDLSDDWWREEVRQGRLYRPRIDMLLNYWLAMRRRDDVSPRRVFREFKSLADDRPISGVMSEVKRDLGNYRRFQNKDALSRDEDLFHYRTGVMQAGVITPVLLLILSATREQRINSLRALESFLIRRMVCRASTKDYNRLSLSLAGELQDKGLDNADGIVIDFLRGQKAESRMWPDDAAISDALITMPLYRMLTRGRIRLVLEGIEERLRRSSMAEQFDVPKNLTIEHVMPQSWRANWPLSDDVEELEAANNRNRLVHTIGNLTLVTRRLNPALSNDAWMDKRKTLRKHTVMLLNERLLAESEGEEWNEEFIQSRSKRMAKLVAEVWPGPDSLLWDQ